jgi:hypothetical protein
LITLHPDLHGHVRQFREHCILQLLVHLPGGLLIHKHLLRVNHDLQCLVHLLGDSLHLVQLLEEVND